MGKQFCPSLLLELTPELPRQFPDEKNDHLPDRSPWLQRDGALPHLVRGLHDYLDTVFSNSSKQLESEILSNFL